MGLNVIGGSGGGSGTVNSGVSGSLAYYPSTDTSVDDASALTFSTATGLKLGDTAIDTLSRIELRSYNTASRPAEIRLNSTRASANDGGDPFILMQCGNTAGTTYTATIGLDQSDSGLFKIGFSNVVGTNDRFVMATTGVTKFFAAGTASLPAVVINDDVNTGIWAPASDTWAVSTGGTERIRIDSSGNVGVGGTPATKLDVLGTGNVISTVRTTSTSGTRSAVLRINEANTGGGDGAGQILFTYDTDYKQAAAIKATLTGGGAAGILTLYTGTTARLTINESGYITAPGVYAQTTASAANVYVDASGNVMRSTSSIRYKTDVKDVEKDEAVKLLDIRPITYSSTCEGDNKTDRHYGFIAEELNLIDPALVNFKTMEDGARVPDGVQYERVVVGLLKLVQDLTKRVEQLEAKVGA